MTTASLEKPLIRIDSEVTRRVRQHARAHMQTEVCGVFIGKMCDGVIEIAAPIEAFNATQAGAQVTFTQSAWETIYRVKDKHYPEDRIVGWYHSHPGFGVFLSEHDTFIHRHFFSSPDQVAWVYDPHSDEEGCFGWVDGCIRRIASIHVADSSPDAPERARQPSAGKRSVPEPPVAPKRRETRPASPPPTVRSRPGFLLRFAVRAKTVSAAGVQLGRSFSRSLSPGNGRRPQTQGPAEGPPLPARYATWRSHKTASSRGCQVNTEDQQEILRVSVDEVEQASSPAPGRTLRQRTATYASIAPSSALKIKPEKDRIVFHSWFYLGAAGLLGSFTAWAIAELGYADGPIPGWGNIWLMPLVVSLMCVGLATAESLIEHSPSKALRRTGLSLLLGAVLGFVLDGAAEVTYNFALGLCGTDAVKAVSPSIWIARGVGWAVIGVAGGVAYGVVGQSVKKAVYGILGGALGAAVGGVIFDPISLLTHGGAPSRAIGLCLLGLSTGSAMGLVESALKNRWLFVTAGPLAGKQFILYKKETTVGSDQGCDIYLFKDPGIEPEHAVLELRASCVHLRAIGPVYVSGERVRGEQVLENGAALQIGRYSFRYQEKEP